jgi:hypothetical protein
MGGAGPLRGLDPTGHARSTGGGKIPKGAKKPTRRKKGAAPKKERSTSVDKGYDLPPIPDHVSAAETVIQEVIPTRERKSKPETTRPSRATRSPTEATQVDELDFLDSPFDTGGSAVDRKKKTSRRKQTKSQKVLTESFPSLEEDHTPADGMLMGDEDDILEPTGESDPLDDLIKSDACDFKGSGLGILIRQISKALFALLGAACLLAGAAALLFTDTIPPDIRARIPADVILQIKKLLSELPKNAPNTAELWGPLLGAGGFFLFLAFMAGRSQRHYRLRNTHLFGEPISLKIGLAAALFQGVSNLIVFSATAGLATPWLIAWNTQFLYQHAAVKARRREKAMDFRGSGFQVLKLGLLTLVSLPLIPLTLGLWAVYLDRLWIAWRQSGIAAPSPSGRGMVRMDFQGNYTSLLTRTLLNVLLTGVTAGLFKPWATAARWRWIARATLMGEEEKGKGRSRGGTVRKDRTTTRRKRK